LEKDFGSSKSVFGFRVLLGIPKSEIQNRNPDFPIERTLDFKVNKTADSGNIAGDDHNGIVKGSHSFIRNLILN